MLLASFGGGRIGLIDGEQITDVTPEPAGAGWSAMRQLIDSGRDVGELTPTGATYSLSDVRLDPPVPDPSKIFAAPVNYRDHQAEMNEETQVSGLGLFLKSPSSLVGSGGSIVLPYRDRRFDQEGELAIVIGRRARHVRAADALDYVFGYTALLDITMRGGEDRSTRKSFETFTPMGPWLVVGDAVRELDSAEITCWVDGEIRQQAKLSDLIWSVAELIAYASSVTTLEPGDVISSGTPAGVGPIEAGAGLEVAVSGLGGRLSVRVDRREDVESVTTGASRGPVPPP